MKRWHILTGEQRWLSEGADMFAATVAAFKREPPKNPGLLTMGWEVGTPVDGDDTTYCVTIRALEKAGYKVNVERPSGTEVT